MDNFWTKDLPSALTTKEFFKDLSECQIYRLYGQLAHMDEICCDISDWLNLSTDMLIDENDPSFFLDDLELNISIVQEQCNNENGNSITKWMIHSTWTTEVPKSELIKGLHPDVLASMSVVQPDLTSSLESFRSWLKDKNVGLQNTMKHLYASMALNESLANLMAIDIFLTDILLGLNRWRFINFNISYGL